MDQKLNIDSQIRKLGLRLPNGTVKKAYRAEFRLPTDLISNPRLVGADELGLDFRVEADGLCTLSGQPAKVGDFTLKLLYDTAEGCDPSELVIPIAFNPNPRDLWRNIPTSPDIQYYKPDSAAEYVRVDGGDGASPRKDMVAASQRGRSHAQDGRPRDDHFALFHCPDSDWYIMAVADGAGSARYSRKGAETACNAVVEHCKSRLLDNPEFETAIADFEADRTDAARRTALTRHVIDIVYNGAVKAHEAIKRIVAANEGFALRDFATTLMFAVCKKFDFGWFISSFWVGDGALCLYSEADRSVKILGTPDEGEFSGQTRFLTMPEIFRDPEVISKRLRLSIVPDFTALYLMTDGVTDPMFETDRNLNDYDCWERFCTQLREGFPQDAIGGVDLSDNNEAAADQLLGWLDFWSPGNHDDRTVAILY